MPDNAKLDQAEAHVAQLQGALDKVQQVLHTVDKVHQDAERLAKALRLAAIGLAIGGMAFSAAAALRRGRTQPDPERGNVGGST